MTSRGRRAEPPLDERDMLGACGHDGPWTVTGHMCARGPGGWHVQILSCGAPAEDGTGLCGRTYLVEDPPRLV
jgi:hypothetical protein